MNHIDPLSYIEDEDRQKYDPALRPLAPRQRVEYAAPAPTGPNVMEPPQVDAPQIPAPSAGPQLPGWRMADEARESTRAALNADEALSQTIANRPQLQRAKGWKGALQTVGEMFLNPAVIHPNYTRQMEEYGQDVGAAEARAKIAANQAEQQRRQAQAEASGEHLYKQGQTEERRQAQIDYEMRHPKPRPPVVLSPGARAVDPETKEVIGEGGPMKPLAPTREEMDAAGTARRIKEADQLGLKGSDRINYIAGKNVIRPPKAGGAGGPKMGTPEQFKQITRQTQGGYAALEEKLKKAVAEAKTNPDIRRQFVKKDEMGQPVQSADGKFVFDPEAEQAYLKSLYDAHEEAKRQLGNSYNQQIVDLGGSIAEPKQAPAAKAAPAASEKLLTEFRNKSGHVFRAGDSAKTKDGKQGIIKGFNPDGSVVFQ